MYRIFKKIAQYILPKDWLIKNETAIRKNLFFLYKGTDKSCNICERSFNHFIKLKTEDQKCPYCGSIDRNRRLWNSLEDHYLEKNLSILHFSPSRPIYRKLKDSHPNYISTDYEGEFLADKKLDITNINEKDLSYDLIICFHVLEHIEQDFLALRELYRILKNGGKCLVQTPFKEGAIYENNEVESKEDRLRHFGQEDHVRIYSVDGLKRRAESVGFEVTIIKFDEPTENKFGFKPKEFILELNKTFLPQ